MRSVIRFAAFAWAALAVIAFSVPDAGAQFYKGKKIELFLAGGAKGSYNRHSRVLQQYLTKHIAGNPEIAITPMPGAGGIKAANYLYNAASRDGLSIGTLLKTIAINEAIERRGVKYKTAKFGWIVSSGPVDSVLALWTATSPAKTVDGVFKKQVILGSTGKGSATFIEPTIMNAMIGTKFKIITGYKGLGKVHLAVERGEVQGRFASWESLKCCKKKWLSEKKVVVLMQSGLVRNKDLPDVPRVIEFAKTDKDREFLKFVAAGSTLGRIYVTPPGVPKAALNALQDGFWNALKDPDYLAITEKRGLEVAPISGEKAKALAVGIVNASPDTIKTAKKYLSRKKKKKK